MTTAGPWQLPLIFRRLLYHEPVTRIRVCGSGPQDLAIEPIDRPCTQYATIKRSGHMWITDWTTRAACKGTDPDELFVQGAAQNQGQTKNSCCRRRPGGRAWRRARAGE